MLLNSGIALTSSKKYTQAEKYLQDGISTAQKEGLTRAYSPFYAALCNLYLKTNEQTKATKTLNQYQKLYESKNLGVKEEMDYLDYAAQIWEQNKDFKLALNLRNKHVILKDSVVNLEQNKKIEELNVKFETAQKEGKIVLLEQNNELVETRNRYFIFGTVGLLFALLFSIVAIWQIIQAKRKADEAYKLRDRLFAFVAHDIKNPISTLQLISVNINRELKKGNLQQIEYIGNTIEKTANNLYTLTDNLLNWVKTQQGNFPHRPIKIVVEDEVLGLLDVFESALKIKNIKINFNPEQESIVWADSTAFQAILRNLLDNAIKFTETQGLISISVEHQYDKINIYVQDSGRGISPEKAAILFENKPEKSENGTFGEKGNGLGLFLCRELAINNGSSLYLQSSNENGSIFVLSFPKIS